MAETELTHFLETARQALTLLTSSPHCQRGLLSRSTDVSDRWVLTVEFDSVTGYRRALSPFAVRELVVPWLATALTDEPAAYEILFSAETGTVRQQNSLIAKDASAIRLGEIPKPDPPLQ